MQVLIKSSFGTSYGWAWQIGQLDAKGATIRAYVGADGDGPHSIVFFS